MMSPNDSSAAACFQRAGSPRRFSTSKSTTVSNLVIGSAWSVDIPADVTPEVQSLRPAYASAGKSGLERRSAWSLRPYDGGLHLDERRLLLYANGSSAHAGRRKPQRARFAIGSTRGSGGVTLYEEGVTGRERM